MRSKCGEGVGGTMKNESPRKTTPIFLMMLMVLAPLAAANVTDFSDGTATVSIEVRDGGDLVNLVDGSIDLPDGETVTSASVTVSTTMVEHGAQATPVSLAAEGFLTDFEGTDGGFIDATDPGAIPASGVGWEHGTLTSSDTPAGCKSGSECWGTNLADTNYTDDNNGQAFTVAMFSEELFVDPLLKSKTATFESWHNLEARAGTQQNTVRFAD